MQEVKKIEDIFNQFSKLHEIGSQEQYLEYIKTIFPQSALKSIFFHGGRKGIGTFIPPENKEDFRKNKGINSGTKDYGIYFTADKNLAKYYTRGLPKNDRQIYPVVLDMRNPLKTNAWFALNIRKFLGAKNVLNPQSITTADYKKFILDKGYDSILWHGIKGEAIVFSPSQIHILGSQKDIKMFQKWVKEQHQPCKEVGDLRETFKQPVVSEAARNRISMLLKKIKSFKNSDASVLPKPVQKMAAPLKKSKETVSNKLFGKVKE